MAINPPISGVGAAATQQPSAANKTVQTNTYAFLAGWVLLIIILMMANKTRLGHVVIYYSLLLMILFILVTEYTRIAPLLGGIETIGQLNQ